MRVPMGRKEQAINAYKGGRMRELEMGKRSGQQVTPWAFTRYLEQIHEQHNYAAVQMKNFTVQEDMKGIIEAAIKRGKHNKAVGADRTHGEMLQVDPEGNVNLLTVW